MAYLLEKIIASAALVAAIISEINHTFINHITWSGFTIFANNVSFILIPVWVLAVAGLWSHDRLYKFFQVAGIALMCMHGLVLSVGGNRQSVLFYFSMFIVSAVTSILIEWRERSPVY